MSYEHQNRTQGSKTDNIQAVKEAAEQAIPTLHQRTRYNGLPILAHVLQVCKSVGIDTQENKKVWR